MTTTLFASVTASQPVAWLQRALQPTARRSVRAMSQEVRELRKGETLVVEQPGGQGVVCLEGSLWITHDHVLQDDVVGAASGARRTKGGTRMLVHALADSRLCLPSPLAA